MVIGWKLLANFCRVQPGNKWLAGRAFLHQAKMAQGMQPIFGLIDHYAATGELKRTTKNRYFSTGGNAPERSFRLAVIQLSVGSIKSENLKNVKKLIVQAACEGAKVIGLPECFNSPYGIQYFEDYAEPIPSGITCKMISSLAQQLDVYIVAGSIPELGEDGKLYNTCMIYGPDGYLLAKHRKVHLFDIDIPGKITFQESEVLNAGNSLTIVETQWCKIGIGICYDLRFPEMAQIYRENGCDLLMYPGAFNMTTGPAHWQLLQQARAVDNQLYVASIAPARDESATYVAWGHSMIVNPWGKILTEAGASQTVLYADIDLDAMEEVRKQIPVSMQRRSDLYELKSKKNID